MPAILVCPLSRLNNAITDCGSRDVLTLMMRSSGIPELSGLGVMRREVVEFSDITESKEGYVLAGPEHIRRILAFSHSWNRQAPLIMHCFAGISRSTAAAYIAACDLMPDRDEADLAMELRQLSPSATPNTHLIRLADDLLRRNGRMVDAIRAIGRGADAFEGEVFRIPVAG